MQPTGMLVAGVVSALLLQLTWVDAAGVIVVPVLTGSSATIAATAATAAVVGGVLAGAGALAVGARLARGSIRGRRRRDVSGDEVSAVWEVVGMNDPAGCTQKLICLLEAAGDDVDQNETQLLAFIGDLKRPAVDSSATHLLYDSAGLLGQFRGAAACESVYGILCVHTRQEMMKLVETVWEDTKLTNNATVV